CGRNPDAAEGGGRGADGGPGGGVSGAIGPPWERAAGVGHRVAEGGAGWGWAREGGARRQWGGGGGVGHGRAILGGGDDAQPAATAGQARTSSPSVRCITAAKRGRISDGNGRSAARRHGAPGRGHASRMLGGGRLSFGLDGRHQNGEISGRRCSGTRRPTSTSSTWSTSPREDRRGDRIHGQKGADPVRAPADREGVAGPILPSCAPGSPHSSSESGGPSC